MVVGFTGTQDGMTKTQLYSFIEVLDGTDIAKFHHGDCWGADAQAHHLVRALTQASIITHPPSNSQKRAFVEADDILPCKDYLKRNRDIVDACDVLIATPKTREEERRSGTWSTVRYARNKKKKVIIIYP